MEQIVVDSIIFIEGDPDYTPGSCVLKKVETEPADTSISFRGCVSMNCGEYLQEQRSIIGIHAPPYRTGITDDTECYHPDNVPEGDTDTINCENCLLENTYFFCDRRYNGSNDGTWDRTTSPGTLSTYRSNDDRMNRGTVPKVC